jgi:hypothetical protein
MAVDGAGGLEGSVVVEFGFGGSGVGFMLQGRRS